MTARNKKIYGNWKILAPDGELLNLVLEKRAKWYLDRNLGDLIDIKTVRLNFEPKGRKTDKYVISEKENKCVVCGETRLEELTKHHIVPSEYRKNLPIEIKSRNCHDVVAICRECHNDYETNYADKLKNEIAERYDIPLKRSKVHDPIVKARKIAMVIINHADMIPNERLKELKSQFTEFTNIEKTNIDIFNNFVEKYEDYDTPNHGKEVVNILVNNQEIEDFMKMWRQHFLVSMKPKHMPKFWSVNRKHEM